MSLSNWMAVAIVAGLPLVAAAQDKTKKTDPANPDEAVPTAVYESAFKNYQPMKESSESPDKIWRAANDEVGRIGGHVGSIKEETSPQESPALATPSQKEAQKSESTPAGHGAHQNHGGK
jgi:hypothetical protein